MLEVRKLSKHFDGLVAIDQIDFAVRKGEIHALIGSNGAGKTTLVNLISGYDMTPTAGTIFFEDNRIDRLATHRRTQAGIAYTFQITNIYKNLSLFENIATAMQFCNPLNKHVIPKKVSQILKQVGLTQNENSIAGNLSYGHQRLLEIAMGLATAPKMMILDEPTQGLSDNEITTFLALIKEINKDITILLIEHNMHVVMSIAEMITVLHKGKILAVGTPLEIRNNSQVRGNYLGSSC